MASIPLQRPEADDVSTDMAARIRDYDWSATPLGPMENWPSSLRFALNLCVHTRYPTAIYWGSDFRLLYNDAWAPVAGKRHPGALGKPAAEVWPDIWDIVGPQLRQVFESGEGLSVFGEMLPMTRSGVLEETYWNYSFTPIFGADGAVEGILNHGHEITKTVRAERRLSFQVALADRLRGLDDPEAVKAAAIAMLGDHLGVARAGYADVDEACGTIAVRSEWTRNPKVRSLARQSSRLEHSGRRLPPISRPVR